MVAEDVALVVAAGGLCHALPERDGYVRVVTCHGCENQSHVVSLALVIARILQAAEQQTLLCYDLCQLCGAGANSGGIEHLTQNLRAILVLYLLAHLLGRMLCHGVRNLMSEDNGERSLVLRDGEQSFVNDNLSARHTEGVH